MNIETGVFTQMFPPDIGYKFNGEYIVNNKKHDIHQVTINGKTHFFTTDKDEVVFFVGDEQIYMSLNPMVNRFTQLPPGRGYIVKSLLTRMGIEIVMIFNDSASNRNLDSAKHFLSSLQLPANYIIEIGYLHKPEWHAHRFAAYDQVNQMLLSQPVIMCLTIGDFCVSSIEMLEEGDDAAFIEIRSKTDTAHQRKHYNTMLRALALMTIPLIWPNAMHMLSYATNPLSVHTMVNRFSARVDNRIFENKTKKEIEKNMPEGESVPIIIPLSSETIERAKRIFSQLIL